MLARWPRGFPACAVLIERESAGPLPENLFEDFNFTKLVILSGAKNLAFPYFEILHSVQDDKIRP
jgi:hypothetical protein